jgi:hypothetical protein
MTAACAKGPLDMFVSPTGRGAHQSLLWTQREADYPPPHGAEVKALLYVFRRDAKHTGTFAALSSCVYTCSN